MQPTLLKAWPSSLRVLLHHTDYRLGEFIHPRALITSGEAIDESLKKRVSSSMDTEMFNFYGCGEFGPIAAECPSHDGLHVNADYLILECLKNGKPVEPNESGVAVLTSLYGFTMPFIRYLLGDICTPTERRCSCGSNFPLIGPPMGRQDEVIRLPNGTALSVTEVVSIILWPFGGIDQYRLIQERPNDFILKLVFMDPPEKEELSKIEARMVAALGESAKVDIEIVDFIEEDEGFKYRRFISKIATNAINIDSEGS